MPTIYSLLPLSTFKPARVFSGRGRHHHCTRWLEVAVLVVVLSEPWISTGGVSPGPMWRLLVIDDGISGRRTGLTSVWCPVPLSLSPSPLPFLDPLPLFCLCLLFSMTFHPSRHPSRPSFSSPVDLWSVCSWATSVFLPKGVVIPPSSLLGGSVIA